MQRSAKPVRKCHACPLNLGDHCWVFEEPRAQWREKRRCPGRDDEALHVRYRDSLKRPDVKTRKELRQAQVGGRRKVALPTARRPKRADRH